MKVFFRSLILLFFCPALMSAAFACPPTERGLPDFNCDGVFKIAFLGDSIVYGVGDKKNKGKGGYVKRLTKTLGEESFVDSFGVPGITSKQLLSRVRRGVKRESSELMLAIDGSDIIVIDVGRNDYWEFGPAAQTKRMIDRIRATLQKRFARSSSVVPVVTASVLLIPNRSFQAPWVRELNELLIADSSLREPNDIRFDRIKASYWTADNLHPSSRGYSRIAKFLKRYLLRVTPSRLLTAFDLDGDLVYEGAERKIFGTDPKLADSDADLVDDFTEIFTNSTDPLDPASF